MHRKIDFKDQVFSVLEAHGHLRVSRSMLYKLIAAGAIKTFKLGNCTLITGAELEKAATGELR